MNFVRSHHLLRYVIIIFMMQGIVKSSDCPLQCACDEGFVICENVEVMPKGIPSTTTSLLLPRNKIRTLSQEDFTGFESNLELLDVSSGRIETVSPGAFIGMDKLTTLDFSGTSLKSVTRDMFSGLKNLENLHLSSTNIKSLTDSPFHDLTSLKTLDLKGNDELNQVSKNAFTGLDNLEELLLGSKSLRYIPKLALSALHSVDHIILQDLPLVSLRSTSFPELGSLKRLCIDNWEKLERIDHGTFEVFPNLTELSITHTAMHSVPTLALSHMDNLDTLKLDNNKNIKSLRLDDFAGLPNLQDLSMKNTGVHDLQGSFSSSNSHLVKLDLSQNQIEDFPTHTLFSLLELEHLNVSFNNISTLGSGTFENNQQLIEVDVSHNPIICDCDLAWLKIWHEAHHGTKDLLGTCASPQNHAGEVISSLDHKYFVCHSPKFNKHNVTVGGATGTTTIIDCLPDQGTPDPDITWKDSKGRDIPTYEEIPRIDPSPNTWQLSNKSLYINSTTVTDFGVYRCTAKNKEGTSLKTFTLIPSYSYGATPGSSGSSVAIGFLVMLGILLPIGGLIWYMRKRKQYTNLSNEEKQRWQSV